MTDRTCNTRQSGDATVGKPSTTPDILENFSKSDLAAAVAWFRGDDPIAPPEPVAFLAEIRFIADLNMTDAEADEMDTRPAMGRRWEIIETAYARSMR